MAHQTEKGSFSAWEAFRSLFGGRQLTDHTLTLPRDFDPLGDYSKLLSELLSGENLERKSMDLDKIWDDIVKCTERSDLSLKFDHFTVTERMRLLGRIREAIETERGEGVEEPAGYWKAIQRFDRATEVNREKRKNVIKNILKEAEEKGLDKFVKESGLGLKAIEIFDALSEVDEKERKALLAWVRKDATQKGMGKGMVKSEVYLEVVERFEKTSVYDKRERKKLIEKVREMRRKNGGMGEEMERSRVYSEALELFEYFDVFCNGERSSGREMIEKEPSKKVTYEEVDESEAYSEANRTQTVLELLYAQVSYERQLFIILIDILDKAEKRACDNQRQRQNRDSTE